MRRLENATDVTHLLLMLLFLNDKSVEILFHIVLTNEAATSTARSRECDPVTATAWW
jgi:hypothetical protein